MSLPTESCCWGLNPGPRPYQGRALPLSYSSRNQKTEGSRPLSGGRVIPSYGWFPSSGWATGPPRVARAFPDLQGADSFLSELASEEGLPGPLRDSAGRAGEENRTPNDLLGRQVLYR